MSGYFRGIVLFLFLLFLVFSAHQRTAADTPLPNLLMQSDNHLLEFTQEGVLVEEIEIPRDEQTDGPARDIVTDDDGGVLVYNGTFQPSMSRRNPITRAWTHSKFAEWSTVNNVTYGGIAALGKYVYVTDMWTALGNLSGLVRFDRSGGPTLRFLEGNEYRHVTVGLDGMLYALSPDEHTVHIIDPTTMQVVGIATISENVGAVTADEDGTLYAAANYGRLLRCKATGELIDALEAEGASFYDISIAPNGQILLSGSNECLYLSDTSFKSLRQVITSTGRFWICHSAFTTPRPSGDVSVAATVAPTQVELGGTVTFTAQFRNKTASALKNVRVINALPSGLSYLSASSNLGTCSVEGGSVVCSVPTLAAGAQGTLTIRVRTELLGTIPNTLRIGGAFNDSTPADNTATAGIYVADMGAPTDLRATPLSKTQIRLNWIDHSATETTLQIDRKVEGGTFFFLLATLPANSNSYVDNDVTTGKEYWYRVRAMNPYGGSAPSNEVRGVAQDPVPAPPSDLRAVTTSSSQVTLQWEDESDNETGFKIERKLGNGAYAQIGTRGAGVTTFINAGLAEGSTYSFRVRATNAHGDSPYSNASTATTLPRAPTNLTGTAGVLRVALSWRDASNTETGYRIERRYENAEFVTVGTTGANATSYLDNTARAGRAYVYQVRAVLGAVVSDPSNFVSVGPPADTPGGKLQVSPKSLKFGTVARGRKATKSFTVRNVGKKALFATVSSPSLPYRVVSGGSTFQLRPGKSRTVRVEFAPTVAGSFPSSLPVASTSLSTRLVTVRLTGKGR